MKTKEEEIRKIIASVLHIPPEHIRSEDKLVDLAPDSLKLFELLVAFEDAFGQEVDYRDVASIETVGQIFDYIKKLGISSSTAPSK